MKTGGRHRIAAVILAGGLAERMGECKILLPLLRRSALEQIVTRMRKAKIRDILVVSGAYGEKTSREAARLGCVPVFNAAYRTGMFSSILAGVRALSEDTDAFFLLPGDTPLVKPATYRYLTDAFYEGYGAPDIVYPTFLGERGHPPLIGRNLIEPILNWSGERGLRGLLEGYPGRSFDVPTADRATVLDMDTPEDYALLQRYAKTEFYPDERECEELLQIARTPVKVIRHMRTVAGCAALVAGALKRCGNKVNAPLLVSACLLHDIAKGEKDHEATGALWLRGRGYAKVAKLVASHKDLPGKKSLKKVDEAEILYPSDKITDGEIVVTLEQRMHKMSMRFAPRGEEIVAAKRRIGKAMAIQDKVERIVGAPLSEILEAGGLYCQKFALSR